ncbi:hypothetical protein [Nonomuraea sp. LPB2021202275-12-8]|uniref:hypothetical protein n=1 Tax=Nonomuraea sp. LPB2021202275-12-8 TaxID=3120159 RepID=UPI00300D9696
MFWRKTRAAIAGFHPLHQKLIWERTLSATLPRAEWAALIASLARHGAVVRRRKWRLPERTESVLVPLIRLLCEDVDRGRVGVTADLRGRDVPGKAGPRQDLPVVRPVRRAQQWWVFDSWLSVRSELRDGSVLELAVTDVVRHRHVVKVNPRGKRKSKTKTKAVQRVYATRSLAKGQPFQQPGSPPPPWIRVRPRGRSRMVIRAVAKLPMPRQADELPLMMTVATELFRWTPARRRRSA